MNPTQNVNDHLSDLHLKCFRNLPPIKKLNSEVNKKKNSNQSMITTSLKAFAENQISESSGKVTNSGLGNRVI